eukprot:GILK01007604.1.p1 GENE.GILK01007604.1~~GILK01007604.1.p1  ORF type:complete len:549 (+),score=70.00 GILK01007604.1:44-1690(+)
MDTYEVLLFLGPQSLCRLAQVSTTFTRTTCHPVIWESLYRSRWSNFVFQGAKADVDDSDASKLVNSSFKSPLAECTLSDNFWKTQFGRRFARQADIYRRCVSGRFHKQQVAIENTHKPHKTTPMNSMLAAFGEDDYNPLQIHVVRDKYLLLRTEDNTIHLHRIDDGTKIFTAKAPKTFKFFGNMFADFSFVDVTSRLIWNALDAVAAPLIENELDGEFSFFNHFTISEHLIAFMPSAQTVIILDVAQKTRSSFDVRGTVIYMNFSGFCEREYTLLVVTADGGVAEYGIQHPVHGTLLNEYTIPDFAEDYAHCDFSVKHQIGNNRLIVSTRAARILAILNDIIYIGQSIPESVTMYSISRGEKLRRFEGFGCQAGVRLPRDGLLLSHPLLLESGILPKSEEEKLFKCDLSEGHIIMTDEEPNEVLNLTRSFLPFTPVAYDDSSSDSATYRVLNMKNGIEMSRFSDYHPLAHHIGEFADGFEYGIHSNLQVGQQRPVLVIDVRTGKSVEVCPHVPTPPPFERSRAVYFYLAFVLRTSEEHEDLMQMEVCS